MTGAGTADGTLVLGSNSTLNVGTPTSRANLSIGSNASNNVASDATGELNALDGVANLRLNQFNIGQSIRGQSATGTFSMGANVAVDATTVNIGTGANASGTVNLTAGQMTANTINLNAGAFNFTGGTLAVDTFNGDLTQLGGTFAPGVTATTSISNINGDYVLTNGTLDIGIGGLLAGSQFDQVDVFNISSLAGTLDVSLEGGFTPSLGDSFDILLAATLIGQFDAVLFPALGGGLGWNIAYLLDPFGTDIVRLTVGPVPVPAAVWLFLSGLLGIAGIARPASSKVSG